MTRLYIRDAARALAPDFAAAVEERDRWLDDLETQRRTWRGPRVPLSAFWSTE